MVDGESIEGQELVEDEKVEWQELRIGGQLALFDESEGDGVELIEGGDEWQELREIG